MPPERIGGIFFCGLMKYVIMKFTTIELFAGAEGIKTGKLLRTPTTRKLMQSKYFIFPGVTRKN